jgi:CHAT domain-containing protein/tetratricopeptide (TPR) repeat protein
LTEVTPEARRASLPAIQQRLQALYGASNYAEMLKLAQFNEMAVRAQAGTKDGRYALALTHLALACDVLFSAFDEAAALYEQALAIRLAARSATQRYDVSQSLNQLGALSIQRGRPNEAAEFFRRAIEIDEKALGPNADPVLHDLDGLAVAYAWLGKYEEAERLIKRALPVKEKTSGADSPAVAILFSNLAEIYAREGRYAEAEALMQRALPVIVKGLGESNPETASYLANMAGMELHQGRFADAEALQRRALAIKEKVLGSDSLEVGGEWQNLGEVQEAEGKHAEAEATFRRALALQQRALGTDNVDVALNLGHLGGALQAQAKYGEAEPLFKAALATEQRVLGENHPEVAVTLDRLALLYAASGDDRNALAYARRASAVALAHAAAEGSGPPDLSGDAVDARITYFRHDIALAAAAARKGIEPLPVLRGEMFEMAQRAEQSSAAAAVSQMALRFASGDGTLASLVRERQDLAAAARSNDKLLIAMLSRPEAQRNQVAIDNVRRQIAQSDSRLAAVSARLEKEFPDFAELSSPKPLKAGEAQALLGADEALIFLVGGDSESHVFVVTRDGFDWKTVALSGEAIAQKVAAFRRGLEVDALSRGFQRPECSEAEASKRGMSRLQCGEVMLRDCTQADARGFSRADCDAIAGRRDLFDLSRAFEFYQTLLGPVDALIKDKRHLLVVPSGALTALPFHLLVTEKPAAATPPPGEAMTAATLAPYRDAAWLIKRQAVTILPSVTSLKALRAFAHDGTGTKPMIGFGDPVFNPEAEQNAAATPARGLATRSFTEFWRGASIDRDRLASALPRLVDTAVELKQVAATLGASPGDIFLREAASETSVKRAALSDYRIVYFATHGLVAGEVKGLAEPSLALSLPRQPSELDDGLLTASEISQLKLNADWVILSACNTIAGGRPGAEALSGLARAFFYAGARALLVSHWSVDSNAATRLTTATFDLMRADPTLRRAEALRRTMLAYMAETDNPANAYPALWAPFEIVGEGTTR